MQRWSLLLLLPLLAACGADPEPAQEQDEPAVSKEEAARATHEGKADGLLDVCGRYGWYGDGACDWFCSSPDPDCGVPALGPEPAGEATTYPIVLAHGFDASPENRWGFYGVEEALVADGHTVYVAQVPPYNAVEVRAGYLAEQVDAVLAQTGAPRVNLVAHSMGGLDGRYLISSLGYGGKVASLTTISSPHQGSAVADVALKLLPGVADDAINALARAWGRTYSEVADETDLRAALTALSEDNAPGFNAANPDDPQVFYQSWAGVSSVFGIPGPWDEAACEGKRLADPRGGADRMDLTLIPMAAMVAHGAELRPNDGMATVEGAKLGLFRGCIPADHLDEVGQIKHDGPDEHTGFDAARFYRNLAFDLAERGL
jgi:triacylglycerol lipase